MVHTAYCTLSLTMSLVFSRSLVVWVLTNLSESVINAVFHRQVLVPQNKCVLNASSHDRSIQPGLNLSVMDIFRVTLQRHRGKTISTIFNRRQELLAVHWLPSGQKSKGSPFNESILGVVVITILEDEVSVRS